MRAPSLSHWTITKVLSEAFFFILRENNHSFNSCLWSTCYVPDTVLLSDLCNSWYMWDLHLLGVTMGEAGVTADLHTSSHCVSSAATLPAPLGFMETERECLSFLLDLPSPPEASRLYKFLLPTVTSGQKTLVAWKPHKLSFGSGSHGPLWISAGLCSYWKP